MAFNPFTSFRKYQKFWMATVLLLCMMTFVLCTGVGGDLSDRLLRLFGRQHGNAWATVQGSTLYRKDFDDLKEQRNVANEFMRKATEVSLFNVSQQLHDPKAAPDEDRKKDLTALAQVKRILEQRLVKPRYFGSGVKVEELIDFKVWLGEADRLGIKLIPEHAYDILYGMELVQRFTKFSPEQMHKVIMDLRSASSRSASEAMVMKALTDEFRVQMAQKVLIEDQRGQGTRYTLTPNEVWQDFMKNRAEFDVTIVPVVVDDFLKKQAAKIPEPGLAELKVLFEQFQKKPFDPLAPNPGFEIPASTKIEFVYGDPKSPKYRAWSKAAVALEMMPPIQIPGPSPFTLLGQYAGDAWRTHAKLEGQWKAARQRYAFAGYNHWGVYQAAAGWQADREPAAIASLIGAAADPFNAAAYAGYLKMGERGNPKAVTAALNEEAKHRMPIFVSTVLASGSGNIFNAVAIQKATLFIPLRKTDDSLIDRVLPLDIVRADILGLFERNKAASMVHDHMTEMRKEMEANAGRQANVNRLLTRLLAKTGLERGTSKSFYDKYSADKAPELKPLRDAYEKYFAQINILEGRDLNPIQVLKETDFYRLFFDGTEPFSVASVSTYTARPWPPKVIAKKGSQAQMMPRMMGMQENEREKLAQLMQSLENRDLNKPAPVIDLFEDAQMPFLFWKTDDRPGKVPENVEVEGVKDRVAQAWKITKARELLALPKAKEIAELLQKSDKAQIDPALSFQALELGRQLIELRGIAILYTETPFPSYKFPPIMPGIRFYTPYQVPKDKFENPREDMSAQVLSLRDLAKPISIAPTGTDPALVNPLDPRLDEINKALFDVGAKNGKIVQILTNRPRSAYYVAYLAQTRDASMLEFRSSMKYAFPTRALQQGTYEDAYFERAHMDLGKEFRKSLLAQLRSQGGETKILAPEAEVLSFDGNEAN